MSDYITSDQMRALEAAAFESGAVRSIDLMERAGQAVVEAIIEHWQWLTPSGRAVVLCGPGNNGGDGFVVARLLKARGWDVVVFFYGDPNRLPADARKNHDLWQAMDDSLTRPFSVPRVTAAEALEFARAAYHAPGADLVIDALFGIGLTRPLSGLDRVLAAHHCASQQAKSSTRPRHVSIDLPSGLSDSGPLGDGETDVFKADLTVTFHAMKEAHRQGARFCGTVVVKDIGL